MAPATGIGLACGLGLPADLTVHWTVIQHRLPFDSRCKEIIGQNKRAHLKVYPYILAPATGIEPITNP